MKQFLRRAAILMAAIPAVLFSMTLRAQVLATGDQRVVTRPHYPQVCETLTAQFNGSERATPPVVDDTERLNAALSQCAGTGKSVVLLRSGTRDAFYSGALTVNGEVLVVAGGVTLFGNNYGTKQFISATGDRAGFMGPGTIDGRADLPHSGTPRLINAKDITNFTVYDITLKNAGKMHLYMERGYNVTVWGLTVATPADTKNTDGVDIDSLSEVTVAHSSIEDGDDGIVVKTNSAPAFDITVKDNLLYGTHGLSVGSQTMYGVSNVLWRNNVVFGTDKFGNVSSDDNGIRIKSSDTCGGEVRQITYQNTLLIGVKHLMYFRTDYKCSGVAGIPYFHDIVVQGLVAAHSEDGAYSEFQGYDAAHPLGLYLVHVHLDSTTQQNSHDANVYLDHSNIVPAGPNVNTYSFMMPPPVH